MPPINRVQVRALRESGVINQGEADFFLNRLDAGQTVDVSSTLIEQANEALIPATLPSPAQRLGRAFASELGESVRRDPVVSSATQAIDFLRDAFSQPVNPEFSTRQEPSRGAPATDLFAARGVQTPSDTAAPAATGQADDTTFDLTAVGGGPSGLQLQSVIGPDGQVIPGIGADAEGNIVTIPGGFQETLARSRAEADARTERSRAQIQGGIQRQRELEASERSRAFEAEQAQLERQGRLQQSALPSLLTLAGQPGGEFLVGATLSRLQGQTPTFNTDQLSAVSPEQFSELFQLSGGGGGGTQQQGNVQLTSQRTGVPVGQLQGRPELLAGAVGRGGIAATGQQELSITPNIQQIMNLTGLQAAELNAIAPQLFGQDLGDLERTARRLAPPAVGRPQTTFR